MTVTATHQASLPLPSPSPSPANQPQVDDEASILVLADNADVKIEDVLEPITVNGIKYIGTDELRITTKNKADQIRIHAGADGKINANVNGMFYELPFDEGGPDRSLVIRTNGGDDKVIVDPDVNVNVYISTGDGDDRVTAQGSGYTRVFGGAGNDFIKLGSGKGLAFGEDGDDLMLAGTGNGVMSGGNGNDRMYAGFGPANRVLHISGDVGSDRLYGGAGKVVLNGGLGDDTLVGHKRTTMYTGKGNDKVYAYDADDRIYAKKTDHIHNQKDARITEIQPSDAGRRAFNVVGSAEFIARVEDKLEELRGSPAGQKVLEEMDKLADKLGSPVVIASQPEHGTLDTYNFGPFLMPSPPNGQHYWGASAGYIVNGVPGAPSTQAKIKLASNHFIGEHGLTPLISFFHEVIHAYHGATGTRLPGEQPAINSNGAPLVWDGKVVQEPINELQTVGLSNSGTPFDFDNDPSTLPTTVHPYPFYENALREEMDVPLRERYTPI